MATTVHVNRMKNDRLIHHFDAITQSYPDILAFVPDGAVVVMQIEGDLEFNDWALKISQKNHPQETRVLIRFVLDRPYIVSDSFSSGDPIPQSVKLEIDKDQVRSFDLS